MSNSTNGMFINYKIKRNIREKGDTLMDLLKIGNFIASCRKAQNLTQSQLAEKLDITDRAVSKWETGRALPDASIMLKLCAILKITVNDLLSGEIISMENKKENEDLLIQLVKEKEQRDRMLLSLEWVIAILSILVLMIPIFIGAFLEIEKIKFKRGLLPKNSYYNNFNWNNNVYIFNEEIKVYEFDDIDIYGFGFNDFYCKDSKVEEINIDTEKIVEDYTNITEKIIIKYIRARGAPPRAV